MAKATAAKAVKPIVEDEASVAEPTIDPVAEPDGDDAPAVETPAEDDAPAVDPSRCVVDDGRCVGRAVNGRVCSYHAAYYRTDGTPR